MGKRIGIEIGSTNIKLSYVDDEGKVVSVKNFEGSFFTPTMLFFDENGDVVIGNTAKELALIEPDRVITNIRKMFSTEDSIYFLNRSWKYEELLSMLLKKVIYEAASALDDNIDGVVVSVPSYYGSFECELIKRAFEIVGIELIQIITNPTASILAYGIDIEKESRNILIYDLGGNTFDVSVASVGNGKIEILNIDGNDNLGGNDWDRAIIEFLKSEFELETGFDCDSVSYFDEYVQQDLLLKSEKAKIMLSAKEECSVCLNIDGYRARIMLSRKKFNSLTEHLLSNTMDITDNLIKKLQPDCIDEILFVGGSTKMPQVYDALFNKYGIKPKIYNPELAISIGAAIYATQYSNKVKKEKIVKCYGLKVLVDDREIRQDIVIKNWRRTDKLVKVFKQFNIIDYGYGKINLKIFEFENDVKSEDLNFSIADLSFNSPNKENASVIQVMITLNDDGKLEINCINVKDGNQLLKTVLNTNYSSNVNFD